MPTPPQHLVFKLSAPIAGTGKTARLTMAEVLKVLAKSGAQQVPAPADPHAARDLSVALKKGDRVLVFTELKTLKGIRYCRQHLSRLEKAGEFPCRFQIGKGRIGYLESEVDAWIKKRADARDLPPQASKK